MKVYFHEIKDQDLEYTFDETTPWIMEVVGSLDERMDHVPRPPNWKPRSRPTQVEFTLRKVDDLIHITGKVKTQLFLLCSICADAFHYPIQTQFHVLLTQSEVYADAPRESSHTGPAPTPFQGWGGDEAEEEEDTEIGPSMDLHATDFEVTVVKEPVVNLKDLLQEQIVLILPMQPKPEKNDNGDCTKCGRSQLSYLPDKQEPLRENPFAVLKNFNKKKTDS